MEGEEGRHDTLLFRPTTNNFTIHHFFFDQTCLSSGIANIHFKDLYIILFEVWATSCCIKWFNIFCKESYKFTIDINNEWKFLFHNTSIKSTPQLLCSLPKILIFSIVDSKTPGEAITLKFKFRSELRKPRKVCRSPDEK